MFVLNGDVRRWRAPRRAEFVLGSAPGGCVVAAALLRAWLSPGLSTPAAERALREKVGEDTGGSDDSIKDAVVDRFLGLDHLLAHTPQDRDGLVVGEGESPATVGGVDGDAVAAAVLACRA